MSHRMVPPFVFLFGGQVTFRTSWRVSLDFVLFGVVCSVCVVYHEDKSLLHTIRDWDAASQALYGQGISPSISDSSRWPCHALLWLGTEPRPIYRSLSLSLSLSSIHWRLSAFCWPFSLDSRDVANARSVTRHPLYMGLLISYNTARHVINRRKLFDLTSRFRSGAPECVIPRRFPAHDWRRCKSNALISHRLFHSGSNGNGTFMSSRWRKGKKIPCPFKHIR